MQLMLIGTCFLLTAFDKSGGEDMVRVVKNRW